MLDRAVFDQLAGLLNEAGVMDELIASYAADGAFLVASVAAGGRDGDLETVAAAVHKLKSSSALFGLRKMMMISRALETAARAGDETAATPLARQLTDLFPETLQALRAAREEIA